MLRPYLTALEVMATRIELERALEAQSVDTVHARILRGVLEKLKEKKT